MQAPGADALTGGKLTREQLAGDAKLLWLYMSRKFPRSKISVLPSTIIQKALDMDLLPGGAEWWVGLGNAVWDLSVAAHTPEEPAACQAFFKYVKKEVIDRDC